MKRIVGEKGFRFETESALLFFVVFRKSSVMLAALPYQPCMVAEL
jgi:hypothetical protein